jgi:DNA end-binding protein Ku
MAIKLRAAAPPRWRSDYEPRGTAMALFTLRAAGEVRSAQFGSAEGDLDDEMVAIAGAIIRQRTGNFDPNTYRDRYQDALQQLIETKMKGLPIKPRAVSTPSPVIDLMAALKRSLAQEPSAPEQRTAKSKRAKQIVAELVHQPASPRRSRRGGGGCHCGGASAGLANEPHDAGNLLVEA